jgi:Siphovirus Gp157
LILDEAILPAKFWKAQDPKLDKKAVLDALKAKEDVPGASLSNGGETISIRVK